MIRYNPNIKDGLNKSWLGSIYAILILVSYVGGFGSCEGMITVLHKERIR